MIDTVYLEQVVTQHPRTLQALNRFDQALTIPITKYTEIFNRKAQNFRRQKANPALIIAQKQGQLLHSAPSELAIGVQHNYYFSHMFNCLYDCRYCFLQGRYRSAHYVWFVNYEDFIAEIKATAKSLSPEPVFFFSGYDCDSLALEPLTRFAESFIPALDAIPNAWLELRTKSTQIRSLLTRPPTPRTLVAFSLSPQEIIDRVEAKTPSLERRLGALKQLQDIGWQIGLRFDPLIYTDHYQTQYRTLFKQVFAYLDAERIHSATLGVFRLPDPYFKNLTRLYPESKLLAGPVVSDNGQTQYTPELRLKMLDFCQNLLSQFLPHEKIFRCP